MLNNLFDLRKKNFTKKRVGRGIGTGKGKTSGRGHKGQKSRSGVSIKGFEGGQMPLHRRLPKHGFNNYFRKSFEIINLSDLQKAIDQGKINISKKIDKGVLKEAGILTKDHKDLKLLGNGNLKSSIKIELSAISKSAMDAVKKSGGTVNVISESKEIVGKKNGATEDKSE